MNWNSKLLCERNCMPSLKTRVKEHMDNVQLGRKKDGIFRYVYNEGIEMKSTDMQILG